VEVVLGQEVWRRATTPAGNGGSSSGGFSTFQFVVDVSAELKELNTSQALELVASLIRRS
jgi:hypothetical protein